MRTSVLAGVVLTLMAGLAAAEGTGLPPGPALMTASGRGMFLRGEVVQLRAELPLMATTPVTVTLRATRTKTSATIYRGTLTPRHGMAALNLLLPTTLLGGDDYTATLQAGGNQTVLVFGIRETTVRSPGMVGDDMCGWMAPAANSRLARETAFMSFMNGPYFDVTGTAISGRRTDLNHAFDTYVDQQMLCWNQDSTRPMSFCPPHSSPITDGEYRRRLVLGEMALMQYPTFAGHLFDYDPTGFQDKYIQLVTYWGWGNLRQDLASYMNGQEDALRSNFKQASGLEAPTPAELLQLAAAMGSPEAMGYIDLPTRRWAAEIAMRSPRLEPARLEALRQRAFAWYAYLMGLNERRYQAYLQPMKALDPSVAISTSNTINHSTPRDGGYHPTSYRPLDFRFSSVWDDQGGAPEHIYETALAATLLNGDRADTQPLWINTVTGWLNGHHLRNTLLLIGRGAQGTGYSSEMGSNLGVNVRTMLGTNADRNQEVDLTGRLMERLGGLLAQARPLPRVGMLYSTRQISMTPYAQSFVDGSFKMMVLLSHAGLTPCLVTEEMLASGQLPASLDAIVVLRQSETLPGAAEQGLRRFAARGGWVVADTHTTVGWNFLRRSAALDMPFRDLGHPYNMMTAYNRQDASITDMHALAMERCPRLRALFAGLLRQLPLDCTNPDVGLAELHGGTARFVAVTNDAQLDLAQMFTPEQRRTTAYQSLLVGHGTGALGSWMPLTADLLVSSAHASGEVGIYDLLRGRRETDIRQSGGARYLSCDMTALPGGFYAVYPAPVGRGRAAVSPIVTAGAPISLSYRATTAAGANLAAVVPVEITLRSPDGIQRGVYNRATDGEGRLIETIPTGVLDPAGAYTVEVIQLLDGAGVRLPVMVKPGSLPAVREAPPIAVRDPRSIVKFLSGKPEVVIPVFNPALKPLAARAAAILSGQGAKARIWENPPVVKYVLGYVVKPDQQPDNDRVDRGEAIGTVQFQNMVQHVNGNFYGSAMTGYRFGKPVVLLGIPGQNPVLDGVRASGLLWTDAATEAGGGGLVQLLPLALDREAATLAISGADLEGLTATVESLAKLPPLDPVSNGVRTARAQLLAGRAVPRRLVAAPAPKGLVARHPTPVQLPVEVAASDVVPVRQVQEWGDTLVVTLGRYGENVALLNPDRKVTVLPAISTTCTVTLGRDILVTSMPGLACGWNREGRLVWRARGELRDVLAGTSIAIMDQDKTIYQVTADGKAALSEWTAPENKPVLGPFKSEVLTERRGQEEVVKGIKVTHVASGQEVPGLHLTAEKLSWNLPFQVQQNLVTGPSGDVLLAFRRWVGESGAELYNRTNGRVSALPLSTAFLTDAVLAKDEQHAALAGMEGEVRVFDRSGRQISSLHTGPYPRLFPLQDGGFAVGSADGSLARVSKAGALEWSRQLLYRPPSQSDHEEFQGSDPERVYAVHREVPLLEAPDTSVVPTEVRIKPFYNYLRDEHGDFRMINQPSAGGAPFDFRWMDVTQGVVLLPAARTYTLTLKTAAKYFDQEPLAQPSWQAILEMRRSVIKNERPAPGFAIYVDGRRMATLTPDGGVLKAFVTPPITEGWALLKPKDDELTTFQGQLDLTAGSHVLGIEALNMEDCYIKTMDMK